jgi:hypothetical protein
MNMPSLLLHMYIGEENKAAMETPLPRKLVSERGMVEICNTGECEDELVPLPRLFAAAKKASTEYTPSVPTAKE